MRLQKVETRNLQLAGTGERLMISNGYNRHNARCRCSPVPARKDLLFAGDSNLQKTYNYLLFCSFTYPDYQELSIENLKDTFTKQPDIFIKQE
jgi:hypothetical protein